MRSGRWSSLVALRERRADQALADSRRADQRCREADQVLDAAAQALDREEARRTVQRRAVYESMAGRALSVAKMAGLLDQVHASAAESRADCDRMLQLTEQRRAAGEAAERAASIHNERRRAVEKSVSIERELTVEQSRKADVHLEIDLEDVAIMTAALPWTAGRRNAG